MGLPKKLIEVALPLEAQRLGLEACASALNPVAVLINKAMTEIPPKFTGRPPVNPESRQQMFGKDTEFRQEEQDRRGGQDLHDLQDLQDLQDLEDLEEERLDSLSLPVTPVLPVSPVNPVQSSVWRGANFRCLRTGAKVAGDHASGA